MDLDTDENDAIPGILLGAILVRFEELANWLDSLDENGQWAFATHEPFQSLLVDITNNLERVAKVVDEAQHPSKEKLAKDIGAMMTNAMGKAGE